ncbi:MAG: transcription elongation factor GreA [Rickettsiales bacterium]|nr:transcription elongation factor GreA [Rickettsiales bacterium]
MEKFPITAEGYAKMEAELKHLKSVERPAVIAAISEARAHGDLSENAEYAAAKEKQSFIEGRINELEDKVSRVDVIDVKSLKGDTIKFGATVTLVDDDSGDEATYQIVGDYEADISRKQLSLLAPLSRALIGKKAGDSIEVNTPKGTKSYEVLKIVYK